MAWTSPSPHEASRSLKEEPVIPGHRIATTLGATAGALLAAILLLAPVPGTAQSIRCWVNANGSRECSDQPPPSTAKDVKDVRGRAGSISSPEPFAQRQASERFPVTLWVNACGEVCTNARKLLLSRGVPFNERNPDRPELQAEFKTVSKGRGQVPMLIVGTTQLVGFEETLWNTTLDAAGYSRTPVGQARRGGQGGPSAPAEPGKAPEGPAGPYKPMDAKNSSLLPPGMPEVTFGPADPLVPQPGPGASVPPATGAR
jgi:glutaredoxin